MQKPHLVHHPSEIEIHLSVGDADRPSSAYTWQYEPEREQVPSSDVNCTRALTAVLRRFRLRAGGDFRTLTAFLAWGW